MRRSGPLLAPLLMGTVAFALLVDEIMLSAIFHVQLGAGNTVAAIALALVGLSASGIAAWLLPALQRADAAARAALVFVTALMLCPLLLMAIPASHGDFVFSAGDVRVRLYRLAIFQLAVIPFFLGGLTLNVLIRTGADRIGRLYAADLFGASLGCVASPLLMTQLGAPQAILCAGLPATVLAGLMLAREGRRRLVGLALPLAIAVVGLTVPGLHTFRSLNTMGSVDAPAYRRVQVSPGDLVFERWALDAWTVMRGPNVPQQWEDFRGWGLGPGYDGPVPETRLVNYNARFSTYATAWDGDFAPLAEWIDADLVSFHQQLGRRYRRVLNVGAGGGREVLAALLHGAERVVAVDVSKVVVEDLMKGRLAGFSGGLYLDPRVEAVADEGRSFAERTHETFDLIEFSIVGGANLEKMDLVRVDDLFTLEALRTYLSRLDEDGVFSYTMYTTRSEILAGLDGHRLIADQPYVPALRTLRGLRQAFEEAWPGRRFADHVLVAGLPGKISPRYDLVHIVVSRSPFTAAERERFVALCRKQGFTLFHPRAAPSDPPGPYALLVESDALDALAASLPYGIRPSTDDRPFQFSLEGAQLRRALDEGALLRLLAGDPLVSLAVRIGALALLVMAIPLLAIAGRRGAGPAGLGRVWHLLILFAGLGFAYMAVEIAALLRLQSYLGKPIYGLSVALFAFLLASGLGSSASARIADRDRVRRLPVVAAVILAMGLLFQAFSPTLFAATLGLPVAARAALAVAAVFPVAFPMGMLFPLGIRLLSEEDEAWIPWAFAINGGFSVLGIFGTRVLAIFAGFSTGMLVGLGVYTLVVVVAALGARARGPQGGIAVHSHGDSW